MRAYQKQTNNVSFSNLIHSFLWLPLKCQWKHTHTHTQKRTFFFLLGLISRAFKACRSQAIEQGVAFGFALCLFLFLLIFCCFFLESIFVGVNCDLLLSLESNSVKVTFFALPVNHAANGSIQL